MVYKCVMKAGQEHKHCVGVGVGLILSFATDSYFRHWKALKILRFDSGLYRLCGKVSVLLAEKGGEKENLFKWECLLSSSVSWGSAEMGEGGSTLSLSQPGVLWPLSRMSHSLCFRNIPQRLPCLGLSWLGMDFQGKPQERRSDSPGAWPELCRGEEEASLGLLTPNFAICIPLMPLTVWLSEGCMWNLWWNSECNLPPGLKST